MDNKQSKPRIPRQQRGIKTKKQITEAAMKLFSEKGFHSTNTKEIAQAAGISIGCFYSYFEDKRTIFIEVLKLYFEQFNRIIISKISLLDPEQDNKKEFLKAVIKSILEAHQVFTNFHNELIVMGFSDPFIGKMISEQEKASKLYILDHLQSWKDAVKTPDLEAASLVVFNSIHAVVDSIIFTRSLDEERVINELVEMVSNYLFL